MAGEDGPGFIQIVTKTSSGEILGATVMAPPAGEIISEIALAMHAKVKSACMLCALTTHARQGEVGLYVVYVDHVLIHREAYAARGEVP